MENGDTHWFNRFLAAFALGGVCRILMIPLQKYRMPAAPVGNPTLRDHLESIISLVCLFLYHFLPIAVSLFAYAVLTHRYRRRTVYDETRCRKCGYILRGIPEPLCPECGKRI